MPDPFVERSLDEIRFWSRIMKEHSFFSPIGFPMRRYPADQ